MRSTALLIAVMSLAACRATGEAKNGGGGGGGTPDADLGGGGGGGGGGGSGGSTTPDAAPDAAPVYDTVKSVRMTPPHNGTHLHLSGLVVVARVTTSKYGHVWVQDAGGGQYSGIQVFCNFGGTNPDCTMTKAQLDGLAIGAVVDVTGQFNNFLLGTAPAGAQAQFEIEAPTITASGGTMTPTAVDVDAATVAKAQLGDPSADPYKGAYVRITGSSSFPVATIAAMEFATTCVDKSSPPQTGSTYGGFEATAGSATLAIGLNLYNTMTYCLPCTGVASPYTCSNPVTSSMTFTSVSGIVEPSYNSNGQVYLEISPTKNADLPHT